MRPTISCLRRYKKGSHIFSLAIGGEIVFFGKGVVIGLEGGAPREQGYPEDSVLRIILPSLPSPAAGKAEGSLEVTESS